MDDNINIDRVQTHGNSDFRKLVTAIYHYEDEMCRFFKY